MAMYNKRSRTFSGMFELKATYSKGLSALQFGRDGYLLTAPIHPSSPSTSANSSHPWWQLLIHIVLALVFVALVALAGAKTVLAYSSTLDTRAIASAQGTSLPGSQHASTRRLLAEDDENGGFLHEIQKSVVIGLITSSLKHDRVKALQESWWLPGLENVVEVYSNTSMDSGISGLVDAKAGPEDAAAHWHKLHYMMKIWALPQYRNVKWFVIGHDSTYLNLANLWGYVANLNHSKPMMIGDVYCNTDGLQYVNGKAGIILSRAVLDTIDWYVLGWPLRSPYRRADYRYDQFLGQYALRKGIAVIPHRGMLSSDYSSQSELYQHLKQYSATSTEPSTADSWPYPIRPISSDQTQNFNFMTNLHQTVDMLLPTSKQPIQESSTTCKCKSGVESKCTFGVEHKGACAQSIANINCLTGPNPVSMA